MAEKFLVTAELQLVLGQSANEVLRKLRAQIESTLSVQMDKITSGFSNFGNAVTKVEHAYRDLERSAKSNVNTMAASNKVIREGTGALEQFAYMSGLAIRRYTGFVLATSAAFGTLRAMHSAIDDAIAFERQMIRVAQTTETSIARVADIGLEISRIAKKWGADSKDLAEVAVILGQAGYTANETKNMLEALAKTTLAATFGDIKETVDGLIATLHQFNLSTSDTERVLSEMNTVSARYAVESEDLIAAVKRGGAAFASAGGNLEEFMALFTAVRQTTRQSAESIATGMNTIFSRIQRPSTILMLEELGARLRDTQGLFVKPMDMIREINRVMAEVPKNSSLYMSVVEEIGGYRQKPRVLPLIQELTLAEKVLGDAQSAQNSLTRDATIAQDAMAVQIKKTKEEFLSLFRAISQDWGFKQLLTLILNITSGLVAMASALRPLLPLLAIFGTYKIGQILSTQGAGIMSSFLKPWTQTGKAGGGFINSGSGLVDDVPALLTKGEYVLQKSAVQRLGLANVEKMNKFAAGGLVTGSRHMYGDAPPDPAHFILSSIISPDQIRKTASKEFELTSLLVQYDRVLDATLKGIVNATNTTGKIANSGYVAPAGIRMYNQPMPQSVDDLTRGFGGLTEGITPARSYGITTSVYDMLYYQRQKQQFDQHRDLVNFLRRGDAEYQQQNKYNLPSEMYSLGDEYFSEKMNRRIASGSLRVTDEYANKMMVENEAAAMAGGWGIDKKMRLTPFERQSIYEDSMSLTELPSLGSGAKPGLLGKIGKMSMSPIGMIGLSYLGQYISQSSGPTGYGNLVGGSMSGLAGGALVGGMFGGLGGPIGAVGGALLGLATSAIDLSDRMKDAALKKSMTDFKDRLDNIAKISSPARSNFEIASAMSTQLAESRGQLHGWMYPMTHWATGESEIRQMNVHTLMENAKSETTQKAISSLDFTKQSVADLEKGMTKEEFKNFAIQVGLPLVNEKSIPVTSDQLKQFGVKGTYNASSNILQNQAFGFGVQQLKKMEETAKALEKFHTALKPLESTLDATSKAITLATSKFKEAGENRAFVGMGLTGGGLNIQASSEYVNAVKNRVINPFGFANAMTQMTGNNMGGVLNQYATIQSQLPAVLAAFAHGGTPDISILQNMLLTKFGKTAPQLVSGVSLAAESALGGSGRVNLSKLMQMNPVKQAEKIMELAMPEFGKGSETIAENFTAMQQMRLDRNAQMYDYMNKIRQSNIQGAGIGYGFGQEQQRRAYARGLTSTATMGLSAAAGKDIYALSQLLPEAGGNFGMANMAVFGGQLQRMNQQALASGDRFEQQRVADVTQRYMEVLRKLTDETTTLVDAQARLAELDKAEESAKNYNLRYMTASTSEQHKMDRDLRRTESLLGGGDFGGLSRTQRRRVLQTLEQLPSEYTMNYGGQQITAGMIRSMASRNFGQSNMMGFLGQVGQEQEFTEGVIGSAQGGRRQATNIISKMLSTGLQEAQQGLMKDMQEYYQNIYNAMKDSNEIFAQATNIFQQSVNLFNSTAESLGNSIRTIPNSMLIETLTPGAAQPRQNFRGNIRRGRSNEDTGLELMNQ
jgi:TP901 family phage tail tape measure protein